MPFHPFGWLGKFFKGGSSPTPPEEDLPSISATPARGCHTRQKECSCRVTPYPHVTKPMRATNLEAKTDCSSPPSPTAKMGAKFETLPLTPPSRILKQFDVAALVTPPTSKCSAADKSIVETLLSKPLPPLPPSSPTLKPMNPGDQEYLIQNEPVDSGNNNRRSHDRTTNTAGPKARTPRGPDAHPEPEPTTIRAEALQYQPPNVEDENEQCSSFQVPGYTPSPPSSPLARSSRPIIKPASPRKTPPPRRPSDIVTESPSGPCSQALPLRRILQPDSPVKLTLSPTSPYDDIFFEINDGTLPKGYAGTIGNVRYYEPPDFVTPESCNGQGLHLLTCDHWIADSTRGPCGVNCKDAKFAEGNIPQPFNCPQCRKTVDNIIDDRLLLSEKERIANLKTLPIVVPLLAYTVQVCTQHAPFGCNVGDTVLALMNDAYGRHCEESPEPEPLYVSIFEMAQHLDTEKRTKRKEEEDMRKKGVKRAASDMVEEMNGHEMNEEDERNVRKKQFAQGDAHVEASWAEKGEDVVGAIDRKRRRESRRGDVDVSDDGYESVYEKHEQKKMRF